MFWRQQSALCWVDKGGPAILHLTRRSRLIWTMHHDSRRVQELFNISPGQELLNPLEKATLFAWRVQELLNTLLCRNVCFCFTIFWLIICILEEGIEFLGVWRSHPIEGDAHLHIIASQFTPNAQK